MAVKKWRRRARRDSGFRFYWIKNDLVWAFFSLFWGGGGGGASVLIRIDFTLWWSENNPISRTGLAVRYVALG